MIWPDVLAVLVILAIHVAFIFAARFVWTRANHRQTVARLTAVAVAMIVLVILSMAATAVVLVWLSLQQ